MSSALSEAVRLGRIGADPRLSRFRPLGRILLFDDFDQGLSGWVELIGNYADSLDNVSALTRDFRPPMLSSATTETGSGGADRGTYSLKIATRPGPAHTAKALKRLTWQSRRRLRCEAYLAYGAEAGPGLEPGDVRAFGVSYDLQDDQHRYWPAIRYLEAENGRPVGRWQYHAGGVRLAHRLPHRDGWADLPGGQQSLGRADITGGPSWHYLRWDVDLASREYLDLEADDRTWDLRGKRHEPLPPMPNLACLLNLGFWVEADRARRCFLYVDSVLLSTEE